MLEASGLRLGNLNSGQFQGFDGTGSEQQANQQNRKETASNNEPENNQDGGDIVAEGTVTQSDNLINIQA